MKKHLWKVLLFLSIFLVGFLGLRSYIDNHTVSQWIKDENIVYIPKTLARKTHHDYLSIDAVFCWVIEPKGKEKDAVLKDIKTESWSKVEYHHGMLLSKYGGYFRDTNVIENIFDSNEKYICVYDNYHKINITNCDDVTEINSPDWLIFVYDAESNLYYCFWVTE